MSKTLHHHHRISAHVSTIMGDAGPPNEECILCILPFPEPTEILAKIQKEHPNVRIIYRTFLHSPGLYVDSKIIDEKCNRTPAMPFPNLSSYLPAKNDQFHGKK